jgi:asparagine synthase (glutamine-hydrolysing)
MCGIVGIAKARERVEIALVETMRDTMTHRGPDDRGSWSSQDGRVAFGHRRLSIIDLSPKGHQPMLSRNGNLCITFNGEIFNYLDLRDELRRLGYTFDSESDTEVILAAYEEWGTESLRRLNGQFAFAMYDDARKRLFVARDRAGEKPLFYRHQNGTFAFASELKALMADPSLQRRVDLQSLNHYLAFGYVPGERCILEGVQKLPQGHALTYELESDAVHVWPYWQLPQPSSNGEVISAERADALVDELHELLRDAVRRQMIADVPVGILLSGGVDSSLVTAMAASVSSRPVKTFTVSFPGHGVYDEAEHARLVAKHFGTDHSELVGEAGNVDLLPQLAAQYDEPMADSSMLPTYLVSKLIRRDATVALGGDGGDELFGGYMHHTWVQRQQRMRAWLPRPLRRAAGAAASTLMPVGMRGRNWIVGFTSDLQQSIAHVNIYFDANARSRLLAPVWRALGGGALAPEAGKVALCDRELSPLQQTTRVDFMTYLPDDILVKVDRASMLTSLEVRAPFLDYRIIEFAYGRVPDSLRATDSGRKLLLRRLAQRVLPPEFDAVRKQGFSIPLGSWFKGEWGATIESILRDADPALFDRKVMDDLIAGQRRGLSNTQRLYALTMFELWRRTYAVTV